MTLTMKNTQAKWHNSSRGDTDRILQGWKDLTDNQIQESEVTVIYILMYPTLYKELRKYIVTFCDEWHNQAVEFCYTVYFASSTWYLNYITFLWKLQQMGHFSADDKLNTTLIESLRHLSSQIQFNYYLLIVARHVLSLVSKGYITSWTRELIALSSL